MFPDKTKTHRRQPAMGLVNLFCNWPLISTSHRRNLRGTDMALPGGALRHPIHFGDDPFHSQDAPM